MTDEQIAKAWASWATAAIVDDLEERGLIIDEDVCEKVHEVILKHLTDIAICNSSRPPLPVQGKADAPRT